MPETSNRDCLAWKLMVEPLRPAPPKLLMSFFRGPENADFPSKIEFTTARL